MMRPGRARGNRGPPAVPPWKAVLVIGAPIALLVVLGMGVTEAYVMVPCAESPVFAAAGDHGRGLCYALKASMLGAPLAGELVLLCILSLMLVASRARLHDRILGTAAGLHAAGMAGVALLLAVNTPVVTSSMILAGCAVVPPGAAGAGRDDAAWPPGECLVPRDAHPVLFEKESKKTHDDYFDLRDARGLPRLVLA